ncbi:metalloregulator ArsR/SmtB family transcription factor [Streptomyces hirsutus]
MARPSKSRVAVSDPAQWLSESERDKSYRAAGPCGRDPATLILLIAQRSRTVKELQEATGLSQTLVSHHLAPLREQNLVEAIPKGPDLLGDVLPDSGRATTHVRQPGCDGPRDSGGLSADRSRQPAAVQSA